MSDEQAAEQDLEEVRMQQQPWQQQCMAAVSAGVPCQCMQECGSGLGEGWSAMILTGLACMPCSWPLCMSSSIIAR